MADQVIPQINLDHVPAQLRIMREAGIPTMLLGGFGVGKTSVVEQFAESIGAHMEVIHGSHYTPTDLLGVGVPVEEKFVRFLMPEIFQRIRSAAQDGKPTILFIDEVTHASKTMLALFMQLTLEGKVAGHELPKDTYIVLAGNRREDRGPLFNMNHILTNRLALYEVQAPTVDTWAAWASAHDVAPEVVAFIMRNPHRLVDVDTSRLINMTPRSWVRAGQVLAKAKDMPSAVRMAALHSLVGPIAFELEPMIELRDKLPSIKEILADPDGAPVPDVGDMAALYMTSVMVAQHFDKENHEALGTYLFRLPEDIAAVGCVIIGKRGMDSLLFTLPGASKYLTALSKALFD